MENEQKSSKKLLKLHFLIFLSKKLLKIISTHDLDLFICQSLFITFRSKNGSANKKLEQSNGISSSFFILYTFFNVKRMNERMEKNATTWISFSALIYIIFKHNRCSWFQKLRVGSTCRYARKSLSSWIWILNCYRGGVKFLGRFEKTQKIFFWEFWKLLKNKILLKNIKKPKNQAKNCNFMFSLFVNEKKQKILKPLKLFET